MSSSTGDTRRTLLQFINSGLSSRIREAMAEQEQFKK